MRDRFDADRWCEIARRLARDRDRPQVPRDLPPTASTSTRSSRASGRTRPRWLLMARRFSPGEPTEHQAALEADADRAREPDARDGRVATPLSRGRAPLAFALLGTDEGLRHRDDEGARDLVPSRPPGGEDMSQFDPRRTAAESSAAVTALFRSRGRRDEPASRRSEGARLPRRPRRRIRPRSPTGRAGDHLEPDLVALHASGAAPPPEDAFEVTRHLGACDDGRCVALYIATS